MSGSFPFASRRWWSVLEGQQRAGFGARGPGLRMSDPTAPPPHVPQLGFVPAPRAARAPQLLEPRRRIGLTRRRRRVTLLGGFDAHVPGSGYRRARGSDRNQSATTIQPHLLVT